MESEIVIIYAAEYNDSIKVVDYIQKNIPVFVNLESCDDKAAIRIRVFISGAICALNGGMEEITQNCLIIHPESIEVKRYGQKSL